MCFLGSKFTQNALAFPAQGAKALPSQFRGREKGMEGEREEEGGERGRGVLGKGKREGREGKGREEKGKVGGKGRGGEFASLALGG